MINKKKGKFNYKKKPTRFNTVITLHRKKRIIRIGNKLPTNTIKKEFIDIQKHRLRLRFIVSSVITLIAECTYMSNGKCTYALGSETHFQELKLCRKLLHLK
jgi:hypothetical protein